MPANVRVIHDTHGAGLEALLKRLQKGDHRVLVGVPTGAGSEENGTSLALVAAVTEFGGGEKRASGPVQQGRNWKGFDPTAERQPARPFLRGGIRKGLPMVRRAAARDLSAVARGNKTMHGALDVAGIIAVGAVKGYMAGPNFAPNAPSTIKRKGSSQPTIEDGQLRQAITSVVVGA